MEPLSPISTICSLPGQERIYFGRPSVLALPGGRILAAVDVMGPDVRNLQAPRSRYGDTNHWMQGRLFASADEGQTWICKQEYAFGQASLFRDGNHVYLLGHHGPVTIMKSPDGGESWSKPEELHPRGTSGDIYSHSPGGALHARGQVYVPLMRATSSDQRRIQPDSLTPVLMWAPEGSNLLSAKNWSWSDPAPRCDQVVPWETLDGIGMPFYEEPTAKPAADAHRRPWAARPGWMYPVAVQVADPTHVWHNPARPAIHLLTAAETQRANLAILARFAESAPGRMTFETQNAPSGRRQVLLPLPGGNRKFDLAHDPDSGQYWLLSNQLRNSMAQPAAGTVSRAELPAEQTSLLQLHFSRNLVDWCGAGWVAGSPAAPLTDPALDFRGRDLCFVACARDAQDPTLRHPKRLVFGLVKNFRDLFYGA